MNNLLEQLVREWYQYRGYHVETNRMVGKRDKDDYEAELNVVAFNPTLKNVVHLETSQDSDSWEIRRLKFGPIFEKGRRFISELYPFTRTYSFKQMAIVSSSNTMREKDPFGPEIEVLLIPDLFKLIGLALERVPANSDPVPETFQCLRAMQFLIHYGGYVEGENQCLECGALLDYYPHASQCPRLSELIREAKKPVSLVKEVSEEEFYRYERDCEGRHCGDGASAVDFDHHFQRSWGKDKL